MNAKQTALDAYLARTAAISGQLTEPTPPAAMADEQPAIASPDQSG